MVQWINAGGTETKNIKNSLLAMPVLRTCRWCCGMSDFKLGLESTTPLTPPSYEVGGIAKRIKTTRLRRKTNI